MASVLPPVVMTFEQLLVNVLRFTTNQATTLINEGYDTLDELLFWDSDDIRTWCHNKSRLTTARGRCPYGDPRVHKLQAYAFWCTDMHRRGLPRTIHVFTALTLIEYKELVRVSKSKAASDSANDIPLPGMLEPKTDWEDW
jgi:hypothetical protein